MQLPKGATVAVADGEKLNLFRNTGDEANPALTALPGADVAGGNKGSGARRQGSSANHDHGQAEEDGYAAGIAGLLNRQVLDGKITDLVIVAAPRALGELRKHYHKEVEKRLAGEVAKDLTGHPVDEIERILQAS